MSKRQKRPRNRAKQCAALKLYRQAQKVEKLLNATEPKPQTQKDQPTP